MKDLNFPLNFTFKISSLANDFIAKDAEDRTIAYVRQKMFKLKEAITVYSDETKTQVNFTIAADKWLDFSTSYEFKDEKGIVLGRIARKGWKSMWKATYELYDQNEKQQYHIKEENAWVKVWDSFLSEIPVVGMLSGYFFNPAYIVSDLNGSSVVKIKKEKSFFGRRFQVTQIKNIDIDDENRIVLGLMMMILLERHKG